MSSLPLLHTILIFDEKILKFYKILNSELYAVGKSQTSLEQSGLGKGD